MAPIRDQGLMEEEELHFDWELLIPGHLVKGLLVVEMEKSRMVAEMGMVLMEVIRDLRGMDTVVEIVA